MSASAGRSAEPQLRSYVNPLSVLVVAIFLLTLVVSGVRVQDTIVAREPASVWGQLVAGTAALCVEGTTALISYRIFDLRRRSRPVSRLLVGGLVFFIVTSVTANVDHSFRYAQALLLGRTGGTLAWEIFLSVFLSIAAPSGLLLFAEMLSEYVQAVDAENAALLEEYQAEVQKMEEREKRRQARIARRNQEARLSESSELLAGRRKEPQDGSRIPPEQSRKAVDLDGWKSVLRLAGSGPFDVSLVRQALGIGKSAAYERLREAQSAGLIRQDGRGRYRFSVSPGSEETAEASLEE